MSPPNAPPFLTAFLYSKKKLMIWLPQLGSICMSLEHACEALLFAPFVISPFSPSFSQICYFSHPIWIPLQIISSPLSSQISSPDWVEGYVHLQAASLFFPTRFLLPLHIQVLSPLLISFICIHLHFLFLPVLTPMPHDTAVKVLLLYFNLVPLFLSFRNISLQMHFTGKEMLTEGQITSSCSSNTLI